MVIYVNFSHEIERMGKAAGDIGQERVTDGEAATVASACLEFVQGRVYLRMNVLRTFLKGEKV
jgi:hypothetical protein